MKGLYGKTVRGCWIFHSESVLYGLGQDKVYVFSLNRIHKYWFFSKYYFRGHTHVYIYSVESGYIVNFLKGKLLQFTPKFEMQNFIKYFRFWVAIDLIYITFAIRDNPVLFCYLFYFVLHISLFILFNRKLLIQVSMYLCMCMCIGNQSPRISPALALVTACFDPSISRLFTYWYWLFLVWNQNVCYMVRIIHLHTYFNQERL